MKITDSFPCRLFPALFLCLLLNTAALGQTCLPGGIVFTSQAQINAFPGAYPGCTQILGSVEIFNLGITNLNGLSAVTSIGGGLSIHDCSLVNLTGLGSLATVSGGLNIYSLNDLNSLAALGSLTTVNGGLGISQTSLLQNLSGLGNLSTLNGGLSLTSNGFLQDLTGLTGLTTINGPVLISGNGSLQNLTGLNNLSSFGGNVNLNANGSLVSLAALGNLTSVTGYLNIVNCDLLPNLGGLGNLASIGDGLRLESNDALASVTALSALTNIGNGALQILDNDLLTSLNGLGNIAPASIGTLEISNSSMLSTCDVASVCNYLSGGGFSTIAANSIGCNNDMEVLAACVPVCGDGVAEGSEGCDDGNGVFGDGCSFCNVDFGWSCSGSPSTCVEVCGNGITTAGEGCDDGNMANGDGCNSACEVEPGFACCGQPSVCSMPATSFTFTGTGSWCDAARWSPSVPPDCFASGTTITINGTCNFDCAFVTLPSGVVLNIASVSASLIFDLTGVLFVNGGSITNNGILLLNNLSGMGNGYLSVQSGTLTNNHNLVLHSNTFLDIAGTLQNNNLLYNEGGAITFQSGSTISSHTLNNLGSVLNFSPNFTITNTCTNLGAGAITNASYGGGGGGPTSQITIQSGATFSNAGSLQNSGHVQNCGTFNNSGTVNSFFGTFSNCPVSSVNITAGGSISCTDIGGGGLVYNAGDVFPGCSPGTMTIGGDFASGLTGELNIELGGTMAGTDYDQLVVSDTATLNGALTVTFFNGFVPASGNSFTVLTCAYRIGTFSSLNLPCALSWTVNYQPTSVTLTFVPAAEICNGLDDDCNGSPESAANTWTGSGDGVNWNSPANWSEGFVPLPCQEVAIPAAANVTVPAGSSAVGKTLTLPAAAQLSVESTATMSIQN